MFTFALVGAKPGRAIPEHVTALLDRPEPADLPFRPEGSLVWSDADDRVRVGAWQVGAEHLGVGCRWHVGPSGLTAFSGHPFHDASPWAEGRTWAAQLADLCERKPLVELASQLDGVYAALSIAPDGRGCVVADPLGIAVLYRAETPDIVIVSSRAAVAARLAAVEGQRPPRDVEAAAWLAYSGNLQTDRTSFRGVRAIPQGSVVTVDPARTMRVETTSPMPWWPSERLDERDLPEAIEAATDHLWRLARTHTGLPTATRTFELTGGRDSRLVLSCLVAQDLTREVACITWGGPDLPDVVIADQLIERYDLRRRGDPRLRRSARRLGGPGGRPRPVSEPVASSPRSDGPEVDFLDRIRHRAWLTSGATSIWDLGGQVHRVPTDELALCGIFGEVLRTNHHSTDGIATMDDLHAFVAAGGFAVDGAGLLRPEVRRRLDRAVVEQLDALRPPAGTPQDAIDGYNQQARLRRWFGPLQEVDLRNRLFPLYSMQAVQLAFAMGSDLRRRERLVFDAMRAGAEDLARIPFAGSQWPAGVGGAPGAGAAYPTEPPVVRWTPPSPSAASRARSALRRFRSPRLSAPTTVSEESRMADIEAKVPVFRDVVDLDRNHPLFDVVDRAALRRSLDDLASLSPHRCRAVHDAVSAAIWLSEAEAPFPGAIDG